MEMQISAFREKVFLTFFFAVVVNPNAENKGTFN
jgi:hypothetical protein